MNNKWLKVALEIAKYAAGAILGALGISLSGCACFVDHIL